MPPKKISKIVLLIIVATSVVIVSCNKDNGSYAEIGAVRKANRFKKPISNKPTQDTLVVNPIADSTENVILVVVDGARYCDTWEAGGALIPYRKELAKNGAVCSNFYNNGLTLTISGHTAIMSGVYETLNNVGGQTPTYPSYMQVWRSKLNKPAEKTWIIASKDKLDVLKNCSEAKWKNSYNPKSLCGVSGLGSGYTTDLITLNRAKEFLQANQPNLMLINFKYPDAGAHAADSLAYVQGIFDTDNYVNLIWSFIQSNAHYKNKTALIVTNDHGRHSPGYLDGFVSHGDGCIGCRHIEFFALGPNFKKNYVSTTAYQQIDIAPTIAYLLGFKMPFGNGKVMMDLLK